MKCEGFQLLYTQLQVTCEPVVLALPLVGGSKLYTVDMMTASHNIQACQMSTAPVGAAAQCATLVLVIRTKRYSRNLCLQPKVGMCMYFNTVRPLTRRRSLVLVPLAIWDASGLSEQPAAVLQCRKRNAQSQMSSTRTAMSCMASTFMI